VWSTVFPFGAVVGREKAKDWGMEDVKGIEVVGVQMAEDSEVDRYERTGRTVQEKVIESGPYRKNCPLRAKQSFQCAAAY